MMEMDWLDRKEAFLTLDLRNVNFDMRPTILAKAQTEAKSTRQKAQDQARAMAREHEIVVSLSDILKAPSPELADRVHGLLDERRRLEREIADLRRKLLTGASADDSGHAFPIG